MGSIGLIDVGVIRVEGTNAPQSKQSAIARAYSAVVQIAV